MTFLAPALLSGLLLATAPIIIHLLNRRRFLRVDWAPMKYLKLTLKSNRRRLRLEQWLLLAVRTLAVIMLFLAVARPMGSGANLAGFLQVQGRASRVVIIDDSLSMGYTDRETSAFARARDATGAILRQIGPQDSVTVFTSSRPEEPLVRHAQLDQQQVARILEQIAALQLSDMASAWAQTFDAADRYLQSASLPIREVIVVTDLWAHGWSSDMTPLCDRWAEQDVTLRLVDVGRESDGNRRVVSLTQADPVALVDTEVHFTAIVKNDNAEPLTAGQATLSVDEEMQAVTLPDLPAGATVSVPIAVTFDTPGLHHISLSIPQDTLPGDNHAHLLVDVRRVVEVTLVDGDPGLAPFESETDFLSTALTAANAPWRIEQAIASEWNELPLGAPDIVILANVDRLPPERIRELESLVDAGMGLMIFSGEQLDIAEYNRLFWKGGDGLLPARLQDFQDADTQGLVIEPHADSALALLAGLSTESLSRIRPRRLIDVTSDERLGDQVRVLARWNNPQASPAVLEKQFGEGKVLFWTTTADRHWSDWPTEPSYVLAVRMASNEIAARVLHWENVTAGQPLRLPLDPDFLPMEAALFEPDSETGLPIPIVDNDGAGPHLHSAPTRLAGLYQANWDEPGVGGQSHPFAVSPDVNDSRPERLDQSGLEPFLGRLTPKLLHFSGDSIEVATDGTELWRYAVVVLIGLIIFESLFAPWVGRAR